MSVSVHINGIRDPDETLNEMIGLKITCDKLNVDYPQKLVEYFNNTNALEMSTTEDIIKEALEVDIIYNLKVDGYLFEGDPTYEGGLVLDLKKLPSDITRLRIYLSD